MRLTRGATAWGLLFALALITGAARGGSIFDDDYVPPSARKKPPTPVASTRTASTSPAKPTTALTLSVPAATAPVRAAMPIPTAAAQAKSRALLKEVYAKELADSSPVARRRFAATLIGEAEPDGVTAADRFVLLAGARQAALDAGDWELCFAALDALATSFGTDRLAAKLEVIAKTSTARKDAPAATSINGRAALGLADELAQAEEFTTAARLLAQLLPSCSNDPMLAAMFSRRAKELTATAEAFDRARLSLNKLAKDPKDPVANLIAGRFRCLNEGNWAAGLPLLVRGNDPALAQLAKGDLAAGTVDELQEAADGWRDYDPHLSGEVAIRAATRARAVTLYGKALDAGATGLTRTAIRKRLDEAPAPGFVDLLKIAKPDEDALHGRWKLTREGLWSDRSIARCEFAYEPPREYLIRVDFEQPGAGNHDAILIPLSHGDVGFAYTIGTRTNVDTGFIGIPPGGDTPPLVQRERWIEPDVRYIATVEVLDGRVRAYLNGELLVDLKTDYQGFTPPTDYWRGRDFHRLGLGSYQSLTCFHHVDVLELSGRGRTGN